MARSSADRRGLAGMAESVPARRGKAGTERRSTERQGKDRIGRQGTEWICGVRRGRVLQAWSGMDGIGKARISRHLTRRNLWMQSGNY